jgi:hypothetical protein
MHRTFQQTRALITGGRRGLGAAEEIAALGAYLAGPEAGVVTGASLMRCRTVEPGTFLLEHVAPAAAFLAATPCDVSGIVIRASNGRFSMARWSHTEEVIFGPGVITPEAVVEWWNTLAGRR